MDPEFSVIIPTYGRPRFLADALASVFRQTVQDLECIVVDDASPSPVTVPADPRVRLIRREENGGSAAARNTGIDHAKGRHVVFLDDDDMFTPERLEIAREGLAASPIALCHLRYLHRPSRAHRDLDGDVQDIILEGLVPHVGTTAVRRDLVPHFNTRYDAIEDIDWWLQLSKLGRISTIPKTGYLFRRHDTVRYRTDAASHVRYRMLFLQDHADYFAAHPRAAAFQWKRVGLFAQKVGDHRTARRAFAQSMRLRLDPASFWHLGRSLRRSSSRVEPLIEAPDSVG